MLSSTEISLLDLKRQLWKARSQAKQKWLEQSLAEPADTPQDAALRMTWIKRALNMVKREQAEIKYQTALIDAYAEHLSAIEMALMGASEQQTPAAVAKSEAESRGSRHRRMQGATE